MKKRFVSMLLAVSCAALICGCGGKEKETKESESTVTVSENDVEDVSDNDATDQDAQDNKQADQDKDQPVSLEYDPTDYVMLGAYKGVEISVPEKVVLAEEDYEIEAKSYYFAYIDETEGVTDRPVELLDMTNIDYVGKKDGVAFDGGTAQGATLLIGSGSFIDGFEEGLVGVMPGETVDLNLKFPEQYHSADLAGQEVVFTVTVNFIAEMKDERVTELGFPGVSTVEEYRQYVKDSIQEQIDAEYNGTAGDAVIKQVVKDSTFAEIPQELIEQNKQEYIAQLEQSAAMYGMTAEQWITTVYGASASYEDVVNEYAENYTKEILVALAVAQYEGMIPTEAELDASLEELAAEYGFTMEEILGIYPKDKFRDALIFEEVLAFLAENAVNKVSE